MTELRDDSPPIELPADTLALLRDFQADRHAQEQRFKLLQEDAERQRVSVAQFRELFREDWQKSQFWYGDDFTAHLAHVLESALPPARSATRTRRIAFLCCPTAFVGFQQAYGDRTDIESVLLEFDDRFETLNRDRARYVRYDLHQPTDVPPDLRDFDLAIADPPFLNAQTNEYIATTLRLILRPDARFILLTSVSVADALPSIYTSAPIGPLHRAPGLHVEHAGGIQNAFGAWTSWHAGEGFGRQS